MIAAAGLTLAESRAQVRDWLADRDDEASES